MDHLPTDRIPAEVTKNPSAEVTSFLANRTEELFIGGQFAPAADGGVFETFNPATDTLLARCASAGRADVDQAVNAADLAQAGAWGRLKPADRSRLLWRVADLIERDAEPLAELETLDNGKPISLSRADDLPQAIEQFRYFSGWATKLDGRTIPVSADRPYLNYTRREAVGVVGQIIPWNYPLLMAAWKLAPALACGNSCVLKPAEQTPLTALWLATLFQEAEFPAGSVNILTGLGESAGAAIAQHPGIRHVAFTGSTEVGRSIVTASAGNLVRVSLELGGKSPNVVFADADLDAAVEGSADAIFYNMGEDCAAGSRLFVEKPVYDEVIGRVADRADSMRLGNGLDLDVDQGPLISAEHQSKVLSYISMASENGAELLAGGGQALGEELERGHFVRPTVFSAATNEMRFAREEIFGPVVAVIPFTDPDDVVLHANDTPYGLGAGVWTRDVTKAHRVAHSLKAGTVWINCYNIYDPASPFGGFGMSGFGREMGQEVLDIYTETKSVWLDLG